MDNAENYHNKNVDIYSMYKNKGKITVYLRWPETLNLDIFNSWSTFYMYPPLWRVLKLFQPLRA